MSREAQEMKRRRRRRFQSQVTVEEADLMTNVEQEADNSKRNSEESDVVLKNQQMFRVQQMATVEWIQQKRKDKDSADGFALRTNRYFSQEESAVVGSPVASKLQRYESSRKLYASSRKLYASSHKLCASSRKMMYQSRATVDPVASFSAIAYPIDMEYRRKKSRSSEALQPGAKYSVVKVTSRSDEPAAKQLTIYEELSKLDVNC
ncbi:putative disease resistance protein [Dorcoceras hygrometricum]|uniref:Putative disease resistance protein n=1 Tax=Dorcoceras hygrometricum TaxID=472368 RepID=A0A2Z7C1P1_9LAMI|nr:putative disease resistance protein [Dorcoceras hygrometricum]